MKSFQATGVWPIHAEVILKRFHTTTPLQNKMRLQDLGSTATAIAGERAANFFDPAVANKTRIEARRLEVSLHSPQVQNELLYYENDGLTRALEAKKKH